MLVTVMNKDHFIIEIGEHTFIPYEEVRVNVGACDYTHKLIRSCSSLRVGKLNNQYYIEKHKLKKGRDFNLCYDIVSQHAGAAYLYAIEALGKPILKHLSQKKSGFINRPVPGPDGKGVNCRFFSSLRINQQAKCPVGPYDVFISHGIADKNYWTGDKIKDFKYAFCPGPTWEKRMRKTGYKGEIFQVGYTKLDPLFDGLYKRTERNKKYIVWCPTHGYNNKNRGRSSYPQCLELINQIDSSIYDVKLCLHPTSKMNNNVKQVPTLKELVDADVVIADAGSTLYEAWALGKPVIFPDWLCAKDVISHFRKDTENLEYMIYQKKIGYHAKDMPHLNQLIEKALVDGMKDEEKAFMEDIFPSHLRGKAGETAAKALMEIKKSL
ncbi:MAG: hypothetical protein ABF289_18315 [Clostridiales bacterium]